MNCVGHVIERGARVPTPPCYRTAGRMHRSLVGGIVQRVAVGFVARLEVAYFKVRIPPSSSSSSGADHGENAFVVLAATQGLAMLDAQATSRLRDAMRGATSPNQPVWRERLESGRLAAVNSDGMEIVHAGRTMRAVAGRAASLCLDDGALDREGRPLDPGAAERGLRIVDLLEARGVDGERTRLMQELRRALSRIERRVAAVTGDLERTLTADAMAAHARLFVAEARRVPRGAVEATATDWSTGEPRTVRMTLDPARGAEEQLAAIFARAKRLKDGAQIARSRLAASESARRTLLGIAERLEAVETESAADIGALAREAHAAAPHDFRRQQPTPSPLHRSAKQAALPPYRSFASSTGARILVGRSGAHNDELSFHVARPHDLWLHVRSRPGAHVVVPLDRGMSCPADVLIEAAHLAAHFSDARDEDPVEIEYTPRKYIRKPRGSAAGLVVVNREKVLVLRRSEVVLRRLLSEELER